MNEIETELSKTFVFKNRQAVLDKLDGVDLRMEIHPQGKEDDWSGDPAITFGGKSITVRHGGKPVSLIGVCLITSTSKMGTGSLSIPAGPVALGGTCPASKLPAEALGEGALEDQICRKCYALKNNYAYELPQMYQAARWEWIKRSIVVLGEKGTARVLADAIKAYYANVKARRRGGEHPAYFRVHDSGDMSTREYWNVWTRVVELCDGIRFWIPTRMPWIPAWSQVMSEFKHKRLTLRPSGYHFNEPAPEISWMSAGTTAHYADFDPMAEGMADFICPAYAAEGACVNAIRLAYGAHFGMKPRYGEGYENPRHKKPPQVNVQMKAMMDAYRKSLTPAERAITSDGWDCRVCWLRPDWSVSYKAH